MADQAYTEIQPTDTFAASPAKFTGTSQALRGRFNGPTAPASPAPYQDWFDTTTGFWKQRNATNDAWIVMGLIGVTNGGMLPLSGGTMTGSIAMAGAKITGLGAPSAPQDVVRKTELDLKANINAQIFTGDIRVTQDPAGNDSLTRKSWTEGRYLKLAGGTMTGALTLSANASSALHAIPLQQLQTFTGFNPTTGHRHNGTDARRVLGTDIDSGGNGAGARLIANGSGTASWSSNSPFVWFTEIISLTDTDPTSLSFQSVDLAPFVSSTAKVALLYYQVFDAMTIRTRANGESFDTGAQDIVLSTSWGTPGRGHWCNLSTLKVFQYRKVSGAGSRLQIRLGGYAQL